MRLKLTIDRGNTAVKAAVWAEDGTLIDILKCDDDQPAGDLVDEVRHRYMKEDDTIAAIAWCTVVASDHAEDEASLAGLADKVVELHSTTATGIEVAYLTPQTLGADRLAAALGAIEVAGRKRPILVSDIGTAVTYDYVAPGGRYLGGNIAPGIDLRLRALAAFTDALPAVSVEGGDIPVWGRTTAEAMRSGAVRGVAAELAYYHAAAGKESIAVLTGGSAELLVNENILTFDYIHDPNLVHKGLFSIIKNEK